jgi:hypothetical protein
MPPRKKRKLYPIEFSNYDQNGMRQKIEELVNDDEGSEKLYKSLDSSENLVRVEYHKEFSGAMDEIVKTEKQLVVATTVKLLNEYGAESGTHAITIFKDETVTRREIKTINIYVFDPNGNTESKMYIRGKVKGYSYYKNPYPTTAINANFKMTDGTTNQNHFGSKGLKTAIEINFNDEKRTLNVAFPKHIGIQSLCENKKVGYIDDCGYCMFLNYLLIEHVIEKSGNYNNRTLTKYVEKITDIPDKTDPSKKKKSLKQIFGETNDEKIKCIGERVISIMENAFPSPPVGGDGRCNGCGKPKKP